MRRTRFLILTLLLLGATSIEVWRGPSPAAAAELTPATSVAGEEGADAGPALLPPIPLGVATMDIPALREELEAALADAVQAAYDPEEHYTVSANGVTSLHLDVAQARSEGEKWIEVNLSSQTLYAWVGDALQEEFQISSGVARYPTIKGVFRMWVRTPLQTMSGGDRDDDTYYNLPNVPWVQYFFGEYAIHGTYWHDSFGSPMSRGCVNLSIEHAEWLFHWTFPGWDGTEGWMRSTSENATLVWVHD